MAWNPSPEVADCREIARKWGCVQVVVVAVYPAGQYRTVSYGSTRKQCDAANVTRKEIHDMIDNEVITIIEVD
jgi:hypothetical protein